MKARNLYLTQGCSHKEIAAQTGLTLEASEQLACREGWTAIRKANKAKLIAAQDSRIQAQTTEAVDAIASLSEQSAIQGLSRVEESLNDRGPFAARNFQSWTGGVRNLVSVMRELRAAPEQEQRSVTLNQFIIRAGDAAVPAVAAAPVEVKATVVAPPLQPA